MRRDVTIASSANSVILVALNVSADGMKSKKWWKISWKMISFSQE
jgi:hypothetical protein